MSFLIFLSAGLFEAQWRRPPEDKVLEPREYIYCQRAQKYLRSNSRDVKVTSGLR